jgi:hypothetical protein
MNLENERRYSRGFSFLMSNPSTALDDGWIELVTSVPVGTTAVPSFARWPNRATTLHHRRLKTGSRPYFRASYQEAMFSSALPFVTGTQSRFV